ncbi:hypothetical protein clem_11585 [Legionella clemsonensis]|uniref:Uncharacterized protein n=2 Tax=Legionella clemsonensis TaxID=1867846 RepID=A0A222P4R8_9GAMM|nr:hypothetical protein clem_11585 [Legionella clemsonensis]
MMYELKQFECLPLKKHNIKLHPKVIEILFENRRYIKNVFSNLKGLHGITHMGMACIDPSHELVAFSTTPNIEYNLFHQNLWLDDHCFNSKLEDKNSLLWWDYQNEKIEKVKLKNNHFTVGMTIYRPIGNFGFMYSFATDEKVEGLRKFYRDNLFGLIDMGDYFYKSLRELYSSYSPKHLPPNLNEFNSKATGLGIRPFLSLVRA